MMFRPSPNHRRLQALNLEDRVTPTINVAVLSTSNNDDSGLNAIVSQLNNDTFFDFTATLVEPTQIDTTAELNNYQIVVIGNNGNPSGDNFNNTTLIAALNSWMSSGGGLVSTGWTVYGASSSSGSYLANLDALVPVAISGGYGSLNANISGLAPSGPSHPINANNAANISNLPTFSEVAFGGIDSGATLLGVLTNGSRPGVVADSFGSGRTVYVALPYAAGTSQTNDSFLRSGTADQLLEQSVAWAGDRVAPTINLTSTPPSFTNSTTATFDFTLSDNGTRSADILFEYNLNETGYFPLTGNTYTRNNLPAKTHSITFRATDRSGNVSTKTHTWTVDTTAPNAPVFISISNDTGPSNTDFYTSDKTLIFNGTAEANSTVELFLYSNSIGKVQANANGDWSFDYSAVPLEDNNYQIEAKATDAAGNVSAVGSLGFTVDTTAPILFDADDAPNLTNEGKAPSSEVGLWPVINELYPDVTLSMTNSAGGRFTLNTFGQVVISKTAVLDGPTSYTLTFEAKDLEFTTTKSFTIVVENIAPYGQLTAPTNVGVGTTHAVGFTTLIDPGEADFASLRFSFATSQAALAPSYATAITSPSVNFNFPTLGTTTVFARVFDKDGGSFDTEVNVTVLPTATLTANNWVVFTDTAADSKIRIGRTPGGALQLFRNDVLLTVLNTSKAVVTPLLSAISGIYVDAGDGFDTVQVDETNGVMPGVSLVGGEGNDTLTGGSGNDTLRGAMGGDSLNGAGGIDAISETGSFLTLTNNSLNGVGLDTFAKIERAILNGGTLDDTFNITATTLAMTINGGTGNDRIVATNDTNFTLSNTAFTRTSGGNAVLSSIEQAQLTGGVGNNRLDATTFTGSVTLDGAAGNDTLQGGAGGDRLIGRDGFDRLYGNGGNDTNSGGNQDDLIFAGLGNDIIYAEAGNDTLHGEGGNDYLSGSDGNDSLTGGDGNDTLFGEAHNDTVSGGNGNDSIRGAAGNDRLIGNAGRDSVFGDQGADYLEGSVDGLADVLFGGTEIDSFKAEFYLLNGVNTNRDRPGDAVSGEVIS